MKTILALAAIAICAGCIGTTVPTPYGRAYRLAVFQTTEASMSWRGTNQTFEVNNYKNTGDAATVEAAAAGAVRGALAMPK